MRRGSPVLCSAELKDGTKCRNAAKETIDGRDLCGVHARPLLVHKANVESELSRYREWQVIGFGNTYFGRDRNDINERIAALRQEKTAAQGISVTRIDAEIEALEAEQRRKLEVS